MQRTKYTEDNKGSRGQKGVNGLLDDLSHSGDVASSSNPAMVVSQQVEERGSASPKGPVTPHRLPARRAPRKLWQEENVLETVRRGNAVKAEPAPVQASHHIAAALHEGYNDEADQGMDVVEAEVNQQVPPHSPAKRRKALCGPCANCGICVTPTWRSGPEGTEFSGEALCNACGTRAFRAANPAVTKAQHAKHRKSKFVARDAQQPLAEAQQSQRATASAAYFAGVKGEDALAQAMHIDNNVQPSDDQRWQALLSAAAAAAAIISLECSQRMQLLGSGTIVSASESTGQPLWQLAAAADCVTAGLGVVSAARPAGKQRVQRKRWREETEEMDAKPVGKRVRLHVRKR